MRFSTDLSLYLPALYLPATHLPALKRFWLVAVLVCGLAAFCSPALAQSLTLDLGNATASTGTAGENGGGGQSGDPTSSAGRIVQLVGLLTVLSFAPGILVMVTSFTRIVVVLSFLRSALGVQQTPPNQVMISLALFLTFFIMAPTFQQAWDNGLEPLVNGTLDEKAAFDESVKPFHAFMMTHVRDKDLQLFLSMGHYETAEMKPEDTPIVALIPAFMISELKRAFEIGFLIFLPFLVIDMVVSSILMAMGMMMLPPIVISLPFKIVFFVLIDGWNMLAGSLVQSYGVTLGAT